MVRGSLVPSLTSGEGRGAEVESVTLANDFINNACVVKPPQKTQREGVQRASGLVITWRCWERDACGEGMEVLPPLPSGCSSVSFIILFYNKTMNISELFS